MFKRKKSEYNIPPFFGFQVLKIVQVAFSKERMKYSTSFYHFYPLTCH